MQMYQDCYLGRLVEDAADVAAAAELMLTLNEADRCRISSDEHSHAPAVDELSVGFILTITKRKRNFRPVTSLPSSSRHTESTEAGVKYLCIREVS